MAQARISDVIKSVQIISACCYLHNFCIRNDPLEHVPEDTDEVHEESWSDASDTSSGLSKRNQLIHCHCNCYSSVLIREMSIKMKTISTTLISTF